MLAALAGASVFLLSGALSAGAATPCAGSVLPGSNFEIDTNANLVVNGQPDCIDWLTDGSGSATRGGVVTKNDKPTGSNDDSFGQGTQEDDPNPTIISGSIPNNKSDLKTFGLYPEVTATGKFLALFWTRVQSPQGTTNMDFELNQKFCDPSATPTNCANNGVGVTPETPLRTVGDKLITYDLANGGTVPTISIRTWTGSAWGSPVDLTAANKALGSINSSAIAANDSGGLGALDPFTFGEAVISFDAVFPNPDVCGAVGSVYMKSRSSTSFQSEVKDFIAPEQVSLSNCTSMTTTAQSSVTVGQPIFDVAHLTGSTLGAGGTITFHLFSDAQCQNEISTGLSPVNVSGDGDYNSGNFTPSAPGTFYWTATYSGDLHNKGFSTKCGDANESSTVVKATTHVTTNAGGPFAIGANGTVGLTDKATLSGGTSNATGTITFKLYGPDTTPNDTSDDCVAGKLLGTATATVNNGANGKDYTSSPAITVNAAGTYHWTASYDGDTNNTGSASACDDQGENPVVNPLGPTLSTNAGGDKVLGVNGTDLSDTATLSGATNDASGTISFHLYGPDPTPNSDTSDDCSNEVAGSPVTKTPVAGNDDYVSPAIHVDKAGTYHWIANYSGDNNNNKTTNGCNGANESVVVSPRDTSLTTDAGGPYRLSGDELPSVDLTDKATLSGGTSDATGTITFTLYGPDPTPSSNPDDDCSGEPVGTASATVAGADGKLYTSSPPITVTEPGTYHWVASYVSGDNNNNGSESSCGAEGENPVVIAPHISVVKSATDQTDEQVIRNGGTAAWTIQVINDGSSTLTNVNVTDAQAPGCARTSADIPALASMDPGDTVTYTCSRDSNTASFTNVAVATGTPDVGDDVSAEDSAHVTVINPAISISKTPHTQTVAFAGTVTFTIGVKNTGDSTLTNVRVTDAQAPGCARTSADIPQLASMAPGDELSYSCTVANVTANFTNVAVATGTPEVGPDVSANDSAAVTVGPPPPPVTHPAISIVKDPKSQTVTVGKTATFKITVTNTGDVALTNVTVTDALSPNCNRTIGTLAPGASTSYTCTRPDVRASFSNVAVVAGTAGDKTVTAQDTAPVTAKKAFVPPKVVPKVVSHKKPKATG